MCVCGVQDQQLFCLLQDNRARLDRDMQFVGRLKFLNNNVVSFWDNCKLLFKSVKCYAKLAGASCQQNVWMLTVGVCYESLTSFSWLTSCLENLLLPRFTRDILHFFHFLSTNLFFSPPWKHPHANLQPLSQCYCLSLQRLWFTQSEWLAF